MNRSLFVPALVAFGFILTTGCGKPVMITSVEAPDSLRTNQTGTFTVMINEDAKEPVTYNWNFQDNNTAPGSTVSHSFRQAGTYNVEVTATNKKGKASDTETVAVVVTDPPVPAQIVSASATPLNPDTRTNVSFSAQTRGDATIAYAWDFGDGSSSTQANPSHTYSQPGTYSARLTATNNAGSDNRTISITVRPYEAAICRSLTEMSAAFFDRNSSVLTAQATAALQENLDILQECPNMSVRVEGWAAPGERNAQQLSEDRGRAVEQFYRQGGLAASRATVQGRGRVSGVTQKDGASQYRRADSIPLR
jgi:PKD repeat protein